MIAYDIGYAMIVTIITMIMNNIFGMGITTEGCFLIGMGAGIISSLESIAGSIDRLKKD